MDRINVFVLISTALVILNPGIVMLTLQIMFLNVVSDFLVAILSTMYWIPIFLFASLWGFLADIVGDRRSIAIITQFVVGILTILHAIFNTYLEIFVLRFLTGLFGAAYTPSIQGYITTDLADNNSGERLGVYNTGVAVGFLFSGILTSALLYLFDVRILFLFAGMSSISACLTLFFLPKKVTLRRRNGFAGAIESLFALRAVKLLKEKRAYMVVFALALRHMAIMGLFSVIFLYMQRIGVQKELLGLISSFNNVVQITLIVPLGRIADRVGYRKIYIPGFFLSAFIPLVFMISRTIWLLAGAFAYVGVAYSFLIAGVNPYLRGVAPRGYESEVLALVNTTRAFGMIFGPVLVGLLVGFYDYGVMFLSITLIGIFAANLSCLAEE